MRKYVLFILFSFPIASNISKTIFIYLFLYINNYKTIMAYLIMRSFALFSLFLWIGR